MSASPIPLSDTSERAAPCRRRPHRKSKTGCAECRRRRVKCGEQKPSCQSCVRHSTQCRYPDASPALAVAASSVPTSATSAPAVVPTAAPAGLFPVIDCLGPPRSDPCDGPGGVSPGSEIGETFGMDAMVLLHHWTLHTSRALYDDPDLYECWQIVFPRIAFQTPFVLHGILSLAALHMAHLDSNSHNREQYTLQALRHHNVSLQGFREAITHITDDSSGEPLFAFSILNVVYTFAVRRLTAAAHEGDGTSGDMRARITQALGTQWIPMLRGVGAILHPLYDRVRLGPLKPLTQLGNWDELDVDRTPPPDDGRFCRARELWAQARDSQCYEDALQLLRRCRLFMAQFETMDPEALRGWGYNRWWAGPMIFLSIAPEEFFARLHQRQPPALILFAYFGTVLHDLNSLWFLEGWGREIVQVTDEVLGDYWSQWMEWPKSVVGL